jgi:hypothetical protein
MEMDATGSGACGVVGGGDRWRGGRRERFGGKNFWENMAAISCLTLF